MELGEDWKGRTGRLLRKIWQEGKAEESKILIWTKPKAASIHHSELYLAKTHQLTSLT